MMKGKILLAVSLLLSLLSRGFAQTLQPVKKDFNYFFQTAVCDEAQVPEFTLPDPLLCQDGNKVTTKGEWEQMRRPELLEMLTTYMYGHVPAAAKQSFPFHVVETDREALGGKSTRKTIKVCMTGNAKGPSFMLQVYLPNRVKGKVPLLLGLSFKQNEQIAGASEWPLETILDSGYGLATFYYQEITPDKPNTTLAYQEGIIPYYYRKAQKYPDSDQWGSVAAWAWAASKAMDFLQTDAQVDGDKIIVMGHSRLGKAALWAGATDQRFAAVIAAQSGCCGAALSHRKIGETVESVNTILPYWFCGNYKQFSSREQFMPFDQHEVIALIAPRPVYISSASDDKWSDPKGEQLGAEGAVPVYALYGKESCIAYHTRKGPHAVLPYDWEQYLRFAASLTAQTVTLPVRSSNFKAGQQMEARGDSGTTVRFVISDRGCVPFVQSCISQDTQRALQAPDPQLPYFKVREALPIPAAYTPTEQGRLVGLDEGVYTHAHSPGFEILPNGDALAIYFSTPKGKAENDTACTFIQARLRFGAEEWDMPELFMNTIGANDQSALLWQDAGRLWFFGGGRDISSYVPFRMATSDDYGATWTFAVPQIAQPMQRVTAQPVSNAFRDSQGRIYIAMDGKSSESLLWRSSDNGVTWQDMGGRTSSRHSTIVPLDDKGTLLSIGGKNASVNGWNPQNISHDWGATWDSPTASPLPPLGTAQRPSMIRLKSGVLLVVGDSYMHKKKIAPPAGWQLGNDCYVGWSKDNGKTWQFKRLPVGLPHQARPVHPSLGYTTVRQAPNGVIHILTSANFPGLHYEFNEAWLYGKEDGRSRMAEVEYLLNGRQMTRYPDGKMQHEVTYKKGYKTGRERFWNPDGTLRWQWQRNLKTHRGTWTHYWANGQKRIVSEWNLRPTPRDLDQPLTGCVADGITRHYDEQGRLTATYHFKNGILQDDQQQHSPGLVGDM